MNWQQPWIIGNWKMNGRRSSTAAFAQAWTTQRLPENVSTGIAAPLPYLLDLKQAAPALPVGAQDVSRFDKDGAFTGETSAAMLADLGAQFVLLGHSERRQYFGENNETLSAKLDNALAAGLTPILCVGETLAQRQAAQEQAVVAEQLSVLRGKAMPHIAVAYEPVWAIGTGQVASPEQIADMHAFIYAELLSFTNKSANIRALYGGSVNAQNAQTILTLPNVDGALVGGASLQADSFAAIVQAAAKQ
ncbi:triose-phosphate isomerase [Eikenella sp. NML99-0057]|uniref:triose-phosphate isomerase n=1 Tax=Eikenella sp. NML99-0057 TaxID=1795834 RepID=UPI0007E20FBB|nr:triose-phosphate isomerase [Eikenella sp. NML99-0057]OAM45708.1 triose-phosphate isomerase [Eikenella sp. NML99-0057]